MVYYMNKTETMAYKWLLKRFKPEEIRFHGHSTPDFTTTNGEQFEVKRIYGKTIWFHTPQLEQLAKMENTTILCFSDKQDPIALFPAYLLATHSSVSGINIAKVEPVKAISVSEENYERLTKLAGEIQAKEGGNKTPNDAINHLFNNLKRECKSTTNSLKELA